MEKIKRNILNYIITDLRPIVTFFSFLIATPILLSTFLLSSSAYLFIHKLILSRKSSTSSKLFLRNPLKKLSKFWLYHAKIWHGYEVVGFENIPKTKPALLIFYHAQFTPIDIVYLVGKTLIEKNRKIKAVGDKDIFHKFGITTLIEATETFKGSHDSCLDYLKNNQLVAISPGGLREALFSKNYETLWNDRKGFARLAKNAKVPIIPVFTQNCQEIFYIPNIFKVIFRGIYEKTRIMLMPIVGWFPVKLKTFIGEPIEFDENDTVEEISEKTNQQLKEIIKMCQPKETTVYSALKQRIIE